MSEPNMKRNFWRGSMSVAVLSFYLFLLSVTPAQAVSKCVAADGSVSYVQGNCPELNQKKQSVRVWDSGRGMKIGPDESIVPNYPAEDQSVQPTPRTASHPCNFTSQKSSERRFEIRACEVLNNPHDPQNQACKTLATGSWKHYANITTFKFKELLAQCQATGGNLNPVGKRKCVEGRIVEPRPFLGKRDELFQLQDGSVWQVTDGYRYLHAYNPEVVVCPGRGQLIIENKIINVRRLK